MHYIGIDYHKKYSYIVVKDEEGRVERRGTVGNTREEILNFVEPHLPGIAVLEAPLLLEAGWTPLVDEVWVTAAPEATVLKRLRERTGMSEEESLARIRSQLPAEERMKQADVIIDTDCTLDELRARLEGVPEWVEYSRTFTQDPLLIQYRSELLNLEKQLAAVRTDSGEKNPTVESLVAQISKIKEDMKSVAKEANSPSGKTESRNPMYHALLDQIIGVEINLIVYKSQLEMDNDKLNKLNREVDQMLSEMPAMVWHLGSTILFWL